jgi:APA family basic amino acid/polyamine antiporter
MARDGHLPGAPVTVRPRSQVPHRADVAVVVVAVVAATVDLRGAIGFSSLGVPAYCTIRQRLGWDAEFPTARRYTRSSSPGSSG